MALFCSYNLNWEEHKFEGETCQDESQLYQDIVIPYTVEEESWLQNQVF